MTTTRGFVTRIEVGRAGLVAVSLINADGTFRFTVSDIDGDPERFNERLTKVAVLRDAMNRAEPVEIESDGKEEESEIERVARITRDELAPPGEIAQVGGLVIGVAIHARNAAVAGGETHDEALVTILELDAGVRRLRLDLQAPERLVVTQQLRLIQDAHATGAFARFLIGDGKEDDSDIIAVWLADPDPDPAGEEDRAATVSVFVESLGLIPVSGSAASAALAVAVATTTPEFTGEGGTVDPAYFTPERVTVLLARGSFPYELVEAGVRDNVRMRFRCVELAIGRDVPNDGRAVAAVSAVSAVASPRGDGERALLLLAAEILAPLSSAARPVWLQIDRAMLDRGPEADCAPGLPSSSLQPRSLRDLRIPYTAAWVGHGCFNPGVYRIQVRSTLGTIVRVDGEDVCLYPTGDGHGGVSGYGCFEGHHTVSVEIPEYVCDTEFDLDIYRIR